MCRPYRHRNASRDGDGVHIKYIIVSFIAYPSQLLIRVARGLYCDKAVVYDVVYRLRHIKETHNGVRWW